MQDKPLKILLIEDNPGDARLTQEVIRIGMKDRVEINWLTRLDEGIAELKRQPYDLILSDLGLPDSFGTETFRRLLPHTGKVAVIILTGTFQEEGPALEAIREGAQDYVVKNELTPGLFSRMVHYALERKRVEIALQEANESLERRVVERTRELRALMAKLQSVREEERAKLSREIHDQLGQELTALKMELAVLKKSVKGEEAKKIDGLSQSVSGLIDTVRQIASQLRPRILDDVGLLAALEWQAKDFEKRTGIRCDYSSGIDMLALSADDSTAIFRIFQEILTNVTRHAQAKRVQVDLKKEKGELSLEVMDNGRGISEAEIGNPRSLGLLGMKERAALLGGSISFEGRPREGTRVTLHVPLVLKDDET